MKRIIFLLSAWSSLSSPFANMLKRGSFGVGMVFLLPQILAINPLTAQEIYVEMKNEFNAQDVKFNWDQKIDDQPNESLVYNFSIGVSGKLFQNVFLKTTVGSNDFENVINIEWESGTIHKQLLGKIAVNQNYFEILPEFRFLEDGWLFVNAGMGFCQVRSSEFPNGGFYAENSELFFEGYEFPQFDGKYEYFAFNLGVNIHHKHMGIVIEYGRRYSGFTETTLSLPGFGINQQSLKLGVSYKFGQE